MADNAFVKIGTALLKHQVKKLVGDETLEVIGEEFAEIGGDKLDAWLNDKSTLEELEKAAQSAQSCFRERVTDNEVQQWMISLPLGNLPKVVEAIDELPSSPNESKLESALRESIALNWKKLSPEQVDNAVNSFLSCLRSALLPIEKQTLMVIGRSVLRTEDKVDLLVRWFEQYIITGKPIEIKQLNPKPVETWHLAHPYPMPPNFTGRVEERKMLADWLNKDHENRLLILRALGGFGKSALTWHWLTHDVESNEWKKVVFWSFYEGDASFEHFIEETLKYLKLEVPQGQRPQVDALLKAMGSQKILLIMDGFERALRAYSSMNAAYQGDESPLPEGEGKGEGDSQLDCVNLNAEIFLKSVCSLPNIKSKVLMTTRLTPRAVKPRGEFMLGCREVELTSMKPEDAVEFFHKQGIKGTHTEIEAACAPYGYHPLSLRLLAGRILKDFENPADIAVAQKFKIDGDIVQQKHHVLEISYNGLPEHEQKLLSTIACFRSPVELKTLEAIAGDVVGTRYIVSLQDDLHDLVARGLLHFEEKNKKFDLHPIVRHYAYQRLRDKKEIHKKLVQHFKKITEFKAHFIGSSYNWYPRGAQNAKDIELYIELYHHLVETGEFDEAYRAIRITFDIMLYQIGANLTVIELLRVFFPDGEDKLPHLELEAWWGEIQLNLAIAYKQSGQPRRLLLLPQVLLALESDGLVEVFISIGAIFDAERYLKGQINLMKSNWIMSTKAALIHSELGSLYSYCGKWEVAEKEFSKALATLEKIGGYKISDLVLGFQAQNALRMIRTNGWSTAENRLSAIIFSKQALEYITKNLRYAHESRLIRAHWLLGASYNHNRLHDLAEQYLFEALVRCRAINLVEIEADILLDLARLRYDQKKFEEAKSLAKEALFITKRCGYVLQGADVNLFLAQYALEQEKDKAKAKGYAEEAKRLATCDGPPYYYKVAYEEAERMLEKL